MAVFLDEAVLYTDCPKFDNRIGYLRLPMLEWHRDEPVLVTLSQNYQGKILIIPQSTDSFGGKLQRPSVTVWPCAVTLYCGYAYESALVAESFQTAVPATLAFASGTLLLALFFWRAFQGRLALDALCGGLAGRLAPAFLPNAQFGPLPVDVSALARNLSLTLLLVFLASRLTGRRQKVDCLPGSRGWPWRYTLLRRLWNGSPFSRCWNFPRLALRGWWRRWSAAFWSGSEAGSSIYSAR